MPGIDATDMSNDFTTGEHQPGNQKFVQQSGIFGLVASRPEPGIRNAGCGLVTNRLPDLTLARPPPWVTNKCAR
jgi:hypothetical protein